MELIVLSNEKKKMIFELQGEDHTYCNLLRDELWNQKGVIAAGYNIKHPLVGNPKFVIEVDSGKPEDALEAAAKDIKKKADTFRKAFAKM